MSFSGSKLALFLGGELLVILRDDRSDIPWPAHWDLPGGGREGDESPEACALRETREEVGLRLAASEFVWSRRYLRPHGPVWFFVAHRPGTDRAAVRLGNEGQRWALMRPDRYCAHPRAVPHFAEQLRLYLKDGNAPAP